MVFLDEIWKAGPAIQNTLLTVINEKLFRNGDTEVHLPLKLLLAASNELPTQGEGLEALWDRFIIRKSIGSVTIAQTDERHNVYVSDRRWKKIVRLLRTSAFVHDRTEVTADDLLPVYHSNWHNTPMPNSKECFSANISPAVCRYSATSRKSASLHGGSALNVHPVAAR